MERKTLVIKSQIFHYIMKLVDKVYVALTYSPLTDKSQKTHAFLITSQEKETNILFSSALLSLARTQYVSSGNEWLDISRCNQVTSDWLFPDTPDTERVNWTITYK